MMFSFCNLFIYLKSIILVLLFLLYVIILSSINTHLELISFHFIYMCCCSLNKTPISFYSLVSFTFFLLFFLRQQNFISVSLPFFLLLIQIYIYVITYVCVHKNSKREKKESFVVKSVDRLTKQLKT